MMHDTLNAKHTHISIFSHIKNIYQQIYCAKKCLNVRAPRHKHTMGIYFICMHNDAYTTIFALDPHEKIHIL